jgi:hypothetical protein
MEETLMEMWGEYFMYNTLFNALPVGTGVAYVTNEVRIDSDADFQFMKTMYFSTNDNAAVYLKYKDDSSGRYLMKNGVNLRTIGGRSLAIDNSGSFDFRPYIWPIPYNIRRATTFSIDASNNHLAIAPSVYISFHGAKLRQGIAPWKKRNVTKMPYVYPLSRNIQTNPESVVTVAPNQTISVSVSIDKDSDFVVNKITGSATDQALVTVQEMGRDRQWMNTSTHIRNLVGSGAFPNVLSSPRFVPRGSVVNFTIQDISGVANNVEINLCGVKLFTR